MCCRSWPIIRFCFFVTLVSTHVQVAVARATKDKQQQELPTGTEDNAKHVHPGQLQSHRHHLNLRANNNNNNNNNNNKNNRRKLPSCDSYSNAFPVTRRHVIRWTGGGGADSEWISADNWRHGDLPGMHLGNKALIAGIGKKASVRCPATYMVKNIELEIRSRATMDIQADLNIGSKFMVKLNAVVTQSEKSTVSVGAMFYLAAKYDISDEAQLVVAGDFSLPQSGQLTIHGNDSRISVERNCNIQGKLNYNFGPIGAGTFHVSGILVIGAYAKLNIDASSYNGPSGIFHLIKYNPAEGSGFFDPAKVTFSGLAEGLEYQQLEEEIDGLYLKFTNSNYPTTPNPTSSPTANPTLSPSTPSPTAAATPLPTASVTPSPTSGNTPKPTTVVTPSPTVANTPNPTHSPIAAGTPSPSKNEGQTTTIILSETSATPIVGAACPESNIEEVKIDGSVYTGGPATLTLFQCASISSGFDPLKFKLVDFAAGLWFEIVFVEDMTRLVIKPLDDYSQFWNRVRLSYKGNYPMQESTDHYPDFSWGTISRWISFRKNPNKGPFSTEDIESIAINNNLSWYGLGSPEDVIRMAQSIKSVNPKYKMLLYWNAESYWGSEIDTFQEAWLKDGVVGTGGRPSYDHSIPAMREWWVNHGLSMNRNSAIDGVFADNTRSPADTDKSKMIKTLADSLPANSMKIGNFLRQRDDNGNRWRMEYEDGTYFENQHVGPVNQPEHESIIVSMQLAREASWKRKLVMWNGSRRNCGCGTIPANKVPAACVGFMNVDAAPEQLIMEDLNKSLAEYLMVAEEYSYFSFNVSPDASCEKWRWDSSGMPQFQKALGRPLGPPLQIGHTFTRHFEHLSVKINLDTEETVFDWA